MRSAERNTRIYLPGAQLVSVMDIEEDVDVHRWTKERWKKDGRKMEGRGKKDGREKDGRKKDGRRMCASTRVLRM